MSVVPLLSWAEQGPAWIKNAKGLRVSLLANGMIGTIEHEEMLINQSRGLLPEGAPFRLWLRSEGTFLSLLNPVRLTEAGMVDQHTALWRGAEGNWTWTVLLVLDPDDTAWTWRVDLAQTGATACEVDVILAQDVGLTTMSHGPQNENYTAHYIDHAVFEHPDWGPVLCARQNLPQEERHPWLAAACMDGAAAFATDAMDVFGLEQRNTGRPLVQDIANLPSRRRQGESACLALQSKKKRVEPGAQAAFSFRLTYVPDHPSVSDAKDLALLSGGVAPPPSAHRTTPVPHSIFDEPELMHARDFDAAMWTRLYPLRTEEEWIDGQLASFMTPDGWHGVAQIKERQVERSHGHLLLGSLSLLPEEEAMGSTVYASGVFNAQVYAGNPNYGRLLSVVRDPLQRLRASGQRVWMRAHGKWRLLGTPSAFVMGLDRAEWWYQFNEHLIHLVSRVESDPSSVVLEMRVVEGDPVCWLITHHWALGCNEGDQGGSMTVEADRLTLIPDADTEDAKRNPGRRYGLAVEPAEALVGWGNDAAIWEDGRSRNAPFVVAETVAVRDVTVRMQLGHPDLTPVRMAAHEYTASSWRIASGPAPLMTLSEILSWFRHDAWIHLASPHGLEQYGGGAWGVRDVCQGPVEWLLGEQRYDAVREILRIVFAHQSAEDGLWPQWFMLGRYADIQQRHCHGDVMFWPIKALCDYAEAANDPGVLDMRVPFMDENGAPGDPVSILDHVERVPESYRDRCVANTALIAYGEGDWDDTLQPAHLEMREGMVSAWTVQLAFQTFGQLAELLKRASKTELEEKTAELRDRIGRDFHQHLMPDGIVAGFALHRADHFEPLLHPRDTLSGIQYRLLPMTRGILSGIFNPEQARRHRELIHEQLRFPDGVRLMDRPVTYEGGSSKLFQRAETSAYFGREVSLQYVHAHLRYAEAMARYGDADALWWALQIVNPLGLTERLPQAARRQANVYFSSSDGDFVDRYEASDRYDELRRGRRAVKSGWRLYSSGPGLYLHKVRSSLFGVRERYDQIEFDPILPHTLLPCSLQMTHEGRAVTLRYEAAPAPSLTLNGQAVAMNEPSNNPYRPAGHSVGRDLYRERLDRADNEVVIGVQRSEPD